MIHKLVSDQNIVLILIILLIIRSMGMENTLYFLLMLINRRFQLPIPSSVSKIIIQLLHPLFHYKNL